MHGDERGVDDEYEGDQEDDYENQREGGGEARETVRGDADDAMEERRAVEGGGPGGANERGRGMAEEKGEKENRRWMKRETKDCTCQQIPQSPT